MVAALRLRDPFVETKKSRVFRRQIQRSQNLGRGPVLDHDLDIPDRILNLGRDAVQCLSHQLAKTSP